VESVVDFCRSELLGVKRQHLGCGQIVRVKISFPLGVLKTRRADPEFHVISSGQIRGARDLRKRRKKARQDIRPTTRMRIQYGGKLLTVQN